MSYLSILSPFYSIFNPTTSRSNRFSLSLSLLLVSLCLSSPTLSWSTDLDALSRNSEVIIFGKVLGNQCCWAETSMNIITHTKFLVEKNVKGRIRPGDTVTIETWGGCINGMKQVRTHSPVLNKGDYALLFLNSGPKGIYNVYREKEGMIPFSAQGEDRVSQDGKKLSNLISDVNLVLEK